MRLGLAFVIVVAAACGNKKADAPAGGSATGSAPATAGSATAPAKGSDAPAAGSGSAVASGGGGEATPKPSAFCMPMEDNRNLSALAADDKTATLCTVGESGEDEARKPSPKCVAVELATGTWSEAKAPPAPVPPAAAAAFEVKQDAKGVQVCKGTACKKLAVPAMKKGEDGEVPRYLTAVNADGTRAVVADDSLKGAWLFDAKTGKKVKALKLVDEGSGCMDGVAFLGDLVYIAVNVCAGPGAEGTIYSWPGKPIGKLEKVNPYGASPIALGGDLYAFSDLNGGAVELVDAKTGKTRAVELPDVECEDCSPLGDGPGWGSPPLVKTPSGKLVGISPKLLAVIDPVAGKLEKQYRFPVCPAKPAAADKK